VKKKLGDSGIMWKEWCVNFTATGWVRESCPLRYRSPDRLSGEMESCLPYGVDRSHVYSCVSIDFFPFFVSICNDNVTDRRDATVYAICGYRRLLRGTSYYVRFISM
jgi:hypothetical protein